MEPEKNKDIVEFAKANNLSEAQAQAFVDMRKAALDAHAKQQEDFEKSKNEVYKRWNDELVNEWGANFDHNINAVNKFMSAHLKSFSLTGSDRLSPSEMKEVLALATKMNDEGTFTQGTQSGTPSKERRPTDFYK
jgi:methionyl-tRNA synthetase